MFFGRDGNKDSKQIIPLLPLRDIVVFPHMVVPLYVGREKSISALKEAVARKGSEEKARIILSAQKNPKTNDPGEEDLFQVATLGQIHMLAPQNDGTMKVLVEGVRRVRIAKFIADANHFTVEVEDLNEPPAASVEMDALRTVQNAFKAYAELNRRIQPELQTQIAAIDDAARLSDMVAVQLALKLADKQALLEETSPQKRLEKLLELMQAEVEILKVEKKIRSRVKKQMDRNQKEYYLNEQMNAIQRELGDRDDGKNDLSELEEKLKSKALSEEAKVKVQKEIKKLKMMGPMSAEATVVRNYVDWVLALPWGEETADNLDLAHAENVLNEDHYGLRKPKERIVEYLAVQTLVKKMKGPILCLVGPPGVGKTSLAKSIARALNRKFVRMSLGGVRDEAEIRGHRRTYIGALPGRILQSMKKAESINPVLLLDEVDKMASDYRGDPSSALLEVLDPEQNHTFNDHYLELDYDLSRVMFICTANSLEGIPGPLRDRLEVIRIAGYTDLEKQSIAKKYLIPKQREANGLVDQPVSLTPKAVRRIIHRYTREAGVRHLERELASVFRKVARRVVKEGHQPVRVTSKHLLKMLGPPKYKYGVLEREDQVGIVTGLAVMDTGGDILTLEATVMPGKGKMSVTGQLRDVMKESSEAAMSFVRARAKRFGIDEKFMETIDVHVHVPEGAIPKDGPSAGVAFVTALVSAVTRIPVRRDVAMTGEVTLRGRVLPIGGLKEKVLAAHRAGMRTVLFPEENKKDLRDIPKRIRNAMRLVPVEFVDDVLREALLMDRPDHFLPAGDAPSPQ